MARLNVAFLWHQHQPYYIHPETNISVLPWVRMHALKDYYDLVAILEDFPDIRQTFNLVPSLIMQLEGYIQGEIKDRVLQLSEKSVAELSREEKLDILKYFFQLNQKNMVRIYPRYRKLLEKREKFSKSGNFDSLLNHFTDQDILDLQVWYNLAWIGESHKNLSPYSDLIKKDHNFNENDKLRLLRAQQELLAKVIPKHKELQDRGQIEITTTPFYHPILPLLCDTNIAKISQPAIQLPSKRFRFPDDAEEQISRAIKFYQKTFGHQPKGMWPSEGSVSEQVLALFAKHGISYVATDEEILFQSLKMEDSVINPNRVELYFPWQFMSKEGAVHLFFRDHTLSDLIGFVYQNWAPQKAAQDFINRLMEIRKLIIESYGEEKLSEAIVSVILDGENCWEFYPQNGKDFLENLYGLLSESKHIQTTTFGEFLKRKPHSKGLKKLFPGSWINHNFAIWIGHPEDNRAWNLLTEAREVYKKAKEGGEVSQEKLDQAYEALLIAEGSDWCWWYGDDHETENAMEFDLLFRSHLIRVHKLLNRPVPSDLLSPIRKEFSRKIVMSEPTGFISPQIDGIDTTYFEWKAAGVFDPRRQGTSMHQSDFTVELIQFGFNLEALFLKLVFSKPDRASQIEFIFFEPKERKLWIDVHKLSNGTKSLANFDGVESSSASIEVAFRKTLEVKIPLSSIPAKAGDKIKFQVNVYRNGELVETWPRNTALSTDVPDQNFEKIEWMI